MARTKLGMPLSTFLNIALAEELNASDEIEEVKKEISDVESHLTFLRSKLCRLEKDKATRIDTNKSIEHAFSICERIHRTHGKIGENQIKNIANLHEVGFKDLVYKCNEAYFIIVKGFEPNCEGKGNTGQFLR